MTDFRRDLKTLLNRYSMENGSNTPDFILAEYLIDSLAAFDKASAHRSHWYRPADGVPQDYPGGSTGSVLPAESRAKAFEVAADMARGHAVVCQTEDGKEACEAVANLLSNFALLILRQ